MERIASQSHLTGSSTPTPPSKTPSRTAHPRHEAYAKKSIFGIPVSGCVLALLAGVTSLISALPAAAMAEATAVDEHHRAGLGLKPAPFEIESEDAKWDAVEYSLMTGTLPSLPIALKQPNSTALSDCDYWEKGNGIFSLGDPEGEAMTRSYTAFINSPRVQSLNLTGCPWPLSFTGPHTAGTVVLAGNTFKDKGGTGSVITLGTDTDIESGDATPTDVGKMMAQFPVEVSYIRSANIRPTSQISLWKELPNSLTHFETDYIPSPSGEEIVTAIHQFPNLESVEFASTDLSDADMPTILKGAPSQVRVYLPGNNGGPATFAAAASRANQDSSIYLINLIPAANASQAPAWVEPYARAVANSSVASYIRVSGNYAGAENMALIYSAPNTAFVSLLSSDNVTQSTLQTVISNFPKTGSLRNGFQLDIPVDGMEGSLINFFQQNPPGYEVRFSSICKTPTCTVLIMSELARSNQTTPWLTIDGFNTTTTASQDAVIEFMSTSTRGISSTYYESMDFSGREADLGNAAAGMNGTNLQLVDLGLTDLPALLTPLHTHPDTDLAYLNLIGNPFISPIQSLVYSGIFSTDRIQSINIDMGDNTDLIRGTFWSIFCSQSDFDGTNIWLNNTGGLDDQTLDWVSFLMPYSTMRIRFSETPTGISAESWAGFTASTAMQQANFLSRLQEDFTLPPRLYRMAKHLA